MVAITLLLLALATACRAGRDAQSRAAAEPNLPLDRLSRLGGWFDVRSSWKFKYKSWPLDLRPRWLGATTWSVVLTDFWHFSQFVATTAQLIAIAIWMLPAAGWWCLMLLFPALIFEPLYRFLRS